MSSRATKFESLLEAVPDALVGMDQSGVIRFVNHQTESLFGYDRDDMVGRHIETLVPEYLWQIYAEHREDYFSDPRARSMGLDLELRAKNKQGEEFPVDVTLSPIDSGEVLLEVTALRDERIKKRAFENAERMMAIIQYSDDAIIGKTLWGTVTSWNPAAERMYGYSPDEIIGRSINILAPQDRTGEMEAILARIRAGQVVDHQVTVRARKDGTLIAVSISVSPIRDEHAEIVGACTIARDVTERWDATQATRTMLELSPDSLVSISPDGKITDANDATVKITGVPRDQLVGTPFSDYFTDPERANQIYQRVFTDGNGVDYPLTIRQRDGTPLDVLYNASVHRGPTGKVRAVFAAARDVTTLTQSYETARAMIESSLDSLVAISPDGLVTDVNEATVTVTGFPREHLVGTAFSDYFTDPERANEIYQRVFTDGNAVDYPLTIRHRDGTLTEVRYNASAYRDRAGNVVGAFAAARDVTTQMHAQRVNAEQQARERDQLLELRQFQRLTVGRELKITELRKENERLRALIPGGGAEPGDPAET